MKRNTKTRKQQTYLFTIRVWAEKLEDENFEWRGKVQCVSATEAYYFRGWLALVEILQTLVSDRRLEEKLQRLRRK
jgi:hypothetical protein